MDYSTTSRQQLLDVYSTSEGNPSSVIHQTTPVATTNENEIYYGNMDNSQYPREENTRGDYHEVRF